MTAFENAVHSFVAQPGYPCFAALKAVKGGEMRWGHYGRLGYGQARQSLRRDLKSYLQEVQKSGSSYLTFWAAFEEERMNEAQFEKRLWDELSLLGGSPAEWAGSPTDPADKGFGFYLEGQQLFVVGLFDQSSRRGRRFRWPSLVFNAFSQFERLKREGLFEGMVRRIRERDLRFHGNVNPMAQKYGEKWETIQFSGRDNSPSWKCPFQFLHGKAK